MQLQYIHNQAHYEIFFTTCRQGQVVGKSHIIIIIIIITPQDLTAAQIQ